MVRSHSMFFFAAMTQVQPVWAKQSQGPYHGPHMMWDHGGGWMFMGPLMLLALVVLIAVVLFVRKGSTQRPETSKPSENKAIQILKERFARGEIDEEEYQQRKRTLTD